ncbi:hypothetical protein [Macrococcus equipercicus]|uniref:Uncharacterized protein n=1 Tax=Macrococcus equipercicus TaxID=69967 RepID=A0A9Q9F165_9STAP|nr:hypothetical protein [Macrococcus equipercicus]KAA1036587.1 hypothetical protein ERX35_010580 [Macrococcus equipercicus]UTH13480.1 hypothetical protein KFV11_09635 [Macrococcus equipercicus]
MSESNEYLHIEVLMEDGVTLSHFERLTTNESITFNNFIAKFDRNANGFLSIKEGDTFSAINVDKILKLTPKDIHHF